MAYLFSHITAIGQISLNLSLVVGRYPFLRHSVVYVRLECGPMLNMMAALPNVGGALCSTPQTLADAHYLSAVQ